MKIDEITIKTNEITIKIDEIKNKIGEMTIELNEIAIRFDEMKTVTHKDIEMQSLVGSPGKAPKEVRATLGGVSVVHHVSV